MKKTITLFSAAALLSFCVGCGAPTEPASSDPDGASSATAQVYSLSESVSVRSGLEPDGEVLLDTSNMEGFMASPHFTQENPYGFALVLTKDGQKDFRVATRDLAKEQSPITLWIGDEAICSPVITMMLNTKYVILNIASVKTDEDYQHTVDLLGGTV